MGRRARRAVLALLAALTLTACTVEEQIRWAFRHHPTAVQDQAVRVAWCESRFVPDARSPSGEHVGIFQMSLRYHGWRPGMDAWWEPVANAVAAEHLYREQGWRPWSCRP